MSEVLARLESLLPSRAPGLWEGLRPPATDDEIQRLRRAVDPFELCPEHEQLLRWRNGAPLETERWRSTPGAGDLLTRREEITRLRMQVAGLYRNLEFEAPARRQTSGDRG